ncbi:hypothetical protein ACFQZQ_05315 [Lysobacter koreensis]|uniref:Uncharacterized protein n=1 Tax=Lysobacter koreensis TaxID=266122 RepID=A0ABW2YPF3_9GAMM
MDSTPIDGIDAAALRALVGAWPGVADGVKWEDDLVFTVAAKMFCVTCLRGPQVGTLSFKVEGEGERLRDALKRIACPTERPAMDGRAGVLRQGRLLAGEPQASAYAMR